jgi:hypothetical protein
MLDNLLILCLGGIVILAICLIVGAFAEWMGWE